MQADTGPSHARTRAGIRCSHTHGRTHRPRADTRARDVSSGCGRTHHAVGESAHAVPPPVQASRPAAVAAALDPVVCHAAEARLCARREPALLVAKCEIVFIWQTVRARLAELAVSGLPGGCAPRAEALADALGEGQQAQPLGRGGGRGRDERDRRARQDERQLRRQRRARRMRAYREQCGRGKKRVAGGHGTFASRRRRA
eukprot:1335654-Pleurochrysis_carterae.AAC.2